jgi:hypothetical protein
MALLALVPAIALLRAERAARRSDTARVAGPGHAEVQSRRAKAA